MFNNGDTIIAYNSLNSIGEYLEARKDEEDYASAYDTWCALVERANEQNIFGRIQTIIGDLEFSNELVDKSIEEWLNYIKDSVNPLTFLIPPDSYDYVNYMITENGAILMNTPEPLDLSTIEVPRTFKGWPVIELGGLFTHWKNTKNIILPNSIKKLDYTFYQCRGLERITIPESVETITAETFFECNSLIEVKILGPITEIPDDCFTFCQRLKSIVIPSSVKKIGSTAFYRCDQLIDIYFTGTQEQWEEINIDQSIIDGEEGNAVLKVANIHYNYKP